MITKRKSQSKVEVPKPKKSASPRKALLMAAFCEFIGPFLFGTAVANTIGKNIIDYSAFDTLTYQVSSSLIIAALLGAITWNLITWYLGIPSSSSHALIGGMVGAVLLAFGPDKITLTLQRKGRWVC